MVNSCGTSAFWEARNLGSQRCCWKSWGGSCAAAFGTGAFALPVPSVFGNPWAGSPERPLALRGHCPLATARWPLPVRVARC